jgi:hypothetical protein
MKEIVVKKTALLEVLKKNRAEHRDTFLAAQKGYRETVIKELDAQLARARSGDPFVLARIAQLATPQDYTDQYDKVIGMLTMDTADTVTLNEHEYTCYVQDEWGWGRQWAVANSAYTTSPKLARLVQE